MKRGFIRFQDRIAQMRRDRHQAMQRAEVRLHDGDAIFSSMESELRDFLRRVIEVLDAQCDNRAVTRLRVVQAASATVGMWGTEQPWQ